MKVSNIWSGYTWGVTLNPRICYDRSPVAKDLQAAETAGSSSLALLVDNVGSNGIWPQDQCVE